MFQELLQTSKEVAEAFEQQKPIVAIESTFITHDMPYPYNFNTANLIAEKIRSKGAVPALIALHQGKIHIGLDQQILHHLATQKPVIKASKRDIAYVLSQQKLASTTVAATAFCTYLAGLPLFITGGLGGVHHHVDESFDISSDLMEIASHPIAVVCSGAKSILDLPKALEVLETHAVAVIGYTIDEFPAFYSQSSGIPLSYHLDNVHEIANLMWYQSKLGIENGLVITNPIPLKAKLADHKMNSILKRAKADAQKVDKHSINPFLIERISELTSEQSLKAHSELLKTNGQLGAEIAIAYQKLKTS